MNSRAFALFAAISLSSVAAFGQVITTGGLSEEAQDGPFQVRYASNLAVGDSVINFTNTGASSTITGSNGFQQNGNLCVNVYAFSPDEQLIECCACPVTPNGLVSLSARADLIANTLTPRTPGSIVIKLLATIQNQTAGASQSGAVAGQIGGCNAATVSTDPTTAGTGANGTIARGLAAWGTTIHALPGTAVPPVFGVTETPFTNSTLSVAELRRLTNTCAFNQVGGSGFGICKSCTFQGQGAVKQ